jgi:hypothetical protein
VQKKVCYELFIYRNPDGLSELSPRRKAAVLPTKDANPKCILVIIADGFDEAETIILLSALRQAGLCVKSVGLTRGLVAGVHGIWLMPDMSFTDLEQLLQSMTISLAILPGGGQSLAKLETDPRVHKLLCQVLKEGGEIAAGPEGLHIVRPAVMGDNELDVYKPALLRDPAESFEAFAQSLIRRLL